MKSILLILSLMITTSSYGSTFISTQMGSYLGFTTVGFGLADSEKTYQVSGILGYVPAVVGGEQLSSITSRADYGFTFSSVRGYFGGGFILSLDRDTFVILPKHYPEGYYPSTGLLFSPYFGGEYLINQNHSLFFEVATLDFYLEIYVRNPEYLSLQDISTFGIGYKYYIP